MSIYFSKVLKIHRCLSLQHLINDATTIYVTHDQSEALTMADTIAVMNDGILQQVGTPEEIYKRPVNRFVATFVGEPPMNIFKGYIKSSFFLSM